MQQEVGNARSEREYGISLRQGEPEWLAFRSGKVGASAMGDITAKLRDGSPGASRAALMGTIIAERLTGKPAESYTNASMQWGKDYEPLARRAYQFERLIRVEQVGFVLHPTIKNAGASPDGLVAKSGLVEIKCPNTHTHIDTLIKQNVPMRYGMQMQWQMACTGRAWCDYVSFDPRMPSHMRLFVKRMRREESIVRMLEQEVAKFLIEVEIELRKLSGLYQGDK